MRFLFTGTNYCGPGGDGPTTSGLDEACRLHDSAYGNSSLSSYFKNQEADTLFLSNLTKVRPRGTRQRLTKYIAQKYFGYKTKFWDKMKFFRGQVGRYQTKIPDYYDYRRPLKFTPVLAKRKRGRTPLYSGMRKMRPVALKQRFHRINIFNRLRRNIYKKRSFRKRR